MKNPSRVRKDGKKEPEPSEEPGPSRKAPTCFICNRIGIHAPECRMSARQIHCFKCRNTGHKAENCRPKEPPDKVSACTVVIHRPRRIQGTLSSIFVKDPGSGNLDVPQKPTKTTFLANDFPSENCPEDQYQFCETPAAILLLSGERSSRMNVSRVKRRVYFSWTKPLTTLRRRISPCIRLTSQEKFSLNACQNPFMT